MTLLKGIGNGAKTQEDVEHIKALNVDWFYTWNHSPRLATPENGVHAEFVPMLWSDSAARTKELPVTLAGLKPAATHLLGFNEPDHESQSNMTTGEARRGWGVMESTGLRLGSPATVAPNVWWMNRFMEDSTKLQDPDLQIDFVACHIYQNPHVGTFLSKIDALHERWGKPVWVTETGVADWGSTTTSKYGRTEINNYLAALWPELQKRPWLERFAWKTRVSTDPQMGTGALYHTNGTLTSTGELYASL